MKSTFDAQEAPRLHGLPPLVCAHTRMLVLSSFPSVASLARVTRTLGLPVHRLPSTSPANASWSFECKLAAWREVVGQACLL